MRKPCPSIMYDIIITWSTAWSGNLSGALVVSMSYAINHRLPTLHTVREGCEGWASCRECDGVPEAYTDL